MSGDNEKVICFIKKACFFSIIITLFLLPNVLADTTDRRTLEIWVDEDDLTPEQEENARSLIRVDNTRKEFYINYSNTGREITRRLDWYSVGGTGWSFQPLEIDLYLGQKIRVIDYTTLAISIFRNQAERRLVVSERLHLCVNNTKLTSKYDRYIVKNSNVCRPQNSGEWTYYELPRLEYNKEYQLRFLEHPTPFIWWLGEGQGGIGNGMLPSCTYIYSDISTNVTQLYVGQKFLLGMRVLRENSYAGCSATRVSGQNYNNNNAWRDISAITTSLSNLNCTGAICYQTSPAWGTWYYRTVTCTEFGNRTIRTLPLGSPLALASLSIKIQCLNPPEPEPDAQTILRFKRPCTWWQLICKLENAKYQYLILS